VRFCGSSKRAAKSGIWSDCRKPSRAAAWGSSDRRARASSSSPICFSLNAQVVRGEADRRAEVAEIVEVQHQRLIQHQVLLLDQVGLAVLPRLLGHARRAELRPQGVAGANCMIRNETIVTPNSVGIMISRRRRM
jgi:hypothetical protein